MSDPAIPLPASTDIQTLAAALDVASERARLAWLNGLPAKQLGTLYDMCEGRTAQVNEMHGDEGQVVIHQGMNSLALFRSFQKRMVLHEGQVKGHNHQPWAWLVGDGTFIVTPSPEVEGELYFDYTRLPDSGFGGFPPVKDNSAGLSRFVYGEMIDVVRRVSEHVVIGKAYKRGAFAGQHFALCRREEG
jgi:hypothetical protein